MRISSIPSKELYDRYLHVDRRNAAVISRPFAVDKVELTEGAKTFGSTLKAAKEALDQMGLTGSGKVDSIKHQIENNFYSVSGLLVAEKILGALGHDGEA